MASPGKASSAVPDSGTGRPSGASADAQADAVTAVTAAADPASPVGSAALPAIVGNVPVAVLLIDQRTGAVTSASAAAMELAGAVALPVSADRWGAAAGLTDLDGNLLAGTDAPLSRVAAGRPLAGEPVRLSPRRSSDADRAGRHDDGDDRLLWVTGFPMTAAGAGLPDRSAADGSGAVVLSLVVFLPVADVDADTDAEVVSSRLREGVVLATDVCFTITDPRQPDDPLVWVNPSFTRVTGYAFEESVGRNCRFLQGPSTDPAVLDELRQALRERWSTAVTLRNHRKDGTAFWNQLSVSPVFDGAGELVSFVGVQSDVTLRVVADAERDRAPRAETAARRTAERAQQRLLLMAEGTSQLSATLDATVLLQRLVDLYVTRLSDWAFVVGLDERGIVTDRAAAHHDGPQPQFEGLVELMATRAPHPGSPTEQVIARGSLHLVNGLSRETMDPWFRTSEGAELAAELGVRSLLTIPVTARGRTSGVVSLIRQDSDFAQDDVEVASDLGRRAAMAIDNAGLYQQEQSVAEILQRALLPQLPDTPGLTAVAHYRSASSEAAVGGGFYDLIALPGGAVGVDAGARASAVDAARAGATGRGSPRKRPR